MRQIAEFLHFTEIDFHEWVTGEFFVGNNFLKARKFSPFHGISLNACPSISTSTQAKTRTLFVQVSVELDFSLSLILDLFKQLWPDKIYEFKQFRFSY